MKVLVFGATGRVGASVAQQAAQANHAVTVFVRDPKRLKGAAAQLKVSQGDVYQPESLTRALEPGFDAVVVAVGADPLKPSTLVTDSTRVIVAAMKAAKIDRYLGITGTAEMPATFLGRLSISILRRTPVGHAVRDHDAAIELVKASGLNWTLVGCPYIKDGPARHSFKTSLVYPGGFKTIHPPDVARLLVEELTTPAHSRAVVGIWY